MTSSIEFITTPTADTPRTTLVLRTQKQHYVFGSQAEGTQRAMVQQGTRLTRAQDFFLTGKTEWVNTGGLIGLMLTLADSASSSYEQSQNTWRKAQEKGRTIVEPPKPKLNLYGPPNLKHMLATCRRFLFRKGVPIVATEFPDVRPAKDEKGVILPSWQNDGIQVWALSVSPLQKEKDASADAEFASEMDFYDRHLNDFEDYRAPESESPEDKEARYNRIRTAVVNYMFNSNWSFDTLIERHISEVEMPATMFVRNPASHRFEPYKGPKPGGTEPLPDITVFTRTPWPGANILALPPTKPTQECVSYIVRTHSSRGQFDVARAKALGIKPGPSFGKLTAGESVQNDKGETITPEMVLGPDKPGQGVAILDIPSREYLEATIHKEELQSAEIMKGIRAIIWMLGPGLSGNPILHDFIRKLYSIQHVISSADHCPNKIALDSVATQTTRLAQVDPKRYQVPVFDDSTLPQKSLYGAGLPQQELPANAIVANRGLSFTLMPKFAMKKDSIPPLFEASSVEQQTATEVLDLANAARQAVTDDKAALLAWKQMVARPDTEVITLGTGSALPSKYRNVSATIVRVPGVGNYLFDCGENTLGQLQRVFSPEELIGVIKDLRMIWISHLHADHHLGTASVIRAWYQIKHSGVPAPSKPDVNSLTADASRYGLSIISHNGMLKWLHEYSSVEDFGYSRILPLEITTTTPGQASGSYLSILNNFKPTSNQTDLVVKKEDYQAIMGISDIQAVRVAHCYGAMAVSITFPASVSDPQTVKPLKISYSGDCRPSMNFARIGYDTTVLIHEATFDDELQGDAKAKKHSTTSEALGIGSEMKAKAVVLTHFSQRYQKIPVLQTVQDGEQEDPLLESNVIEDAAEEVQNDDDEVDPTIQNTDNMDIHPTLAAKPAGKPHAPTLQHQGSATLQDNERIIKIRSKDMKVAIAFDYMRVQIGEIIELEKFSDALNRLLIEEDDETGALDNGEGSINKNGKKTSGDEAGGNKKAKKARRNN